MTTLALLLPVASQGIELSDCRISAGPAFPGIKARCGTLQRPLDPDDPASPPIELKVAVVPALDLEPAPDPLVPIAGGPGQGSVAFYAAYAAAFEPSRRERDILLVDQRGTGESAPLRCEVDDEVIEGRYSREQTIEYTRECLENLPHDPRFFTTSVAVTDLEAVCVALGYGPLNLYGVSYGTRVAQHYARRYPDSTRTIVLDGVVPPGVALGPEIATGAQAAVDRVFERCAESPECSAAFPELREGFRALVAALEAEPVEVQVTDPLTGESGAIRFGRPELAAAVRLLAYHPHTVALIPLLLDAAANGRYAPIAAQYLMTVRNLTDSIAIGMHNSVMCAEDVPFWDDEAIDYAAIEASFIGLFQLDAIAAICSVWPTGPVDPGLAKPLEGDVPVLLLSGSADPITPPRYAELAMPGLGRARHLTGADQGHGQAATGCMPRLIAEFLETADPDALDAGCFERSFVMPFFLDFTGPSP